MRRVGRSQKFALIILLLLLFRFPVFTGEIDWDRMSFGITVNYQHPLGDFGTYWTNAIGVGGFGRYEVLNRVYLMGTMTVSYFTPSPDTGAKSIPHLWLVNLSGSIHYAIPFSSRLRGIIALGGDNFTFIFRGTPAERLGSNYIESEVAVHGELGLGITFFGAARIDLYTRYTTIFSYPDQIPIWISGIYVYL